MLILLPRYWHGVCFYINKTMFISWISGKILELGMEMMTASGAVAWMEFEDLLAEFGSVYMEVDFGSRDA